MSKLLIYTDGSSRGNPGPGGWGVNISQVEY
jgi:ribonuclease HI